MNCFNIRELQSLLRNRFFLELQGDDLFYKNCSGVLARLTYRINNFLYLPVGNFSGFQTLHHFKLSDSLTKMPTLFNIKYNALATPSKLKGQNGFLSRNGLYFNSLTHPNIVYKIKTGNYLNEDLSRTNYTNAPLSVNFKSLLGLHEAWYSSKAFEL